MIAIRPGVFPTGEGCPVAIDDIIALGIDETARHILDDFRARAQFALGEFDADDPADFDRSTVQTRQASVERMLTQALSSTSSTPKRISTLLDLVDLPTGTFDIEEVLTDLMEFISEDLSKEGHADHEFILEQDKVVYHLDWVDVGKPRVWVVDSPYAVRCERYGLYNAGDLSRLDDVGEWTRCPPCVPGAVVIP
jgi:hypothetical protein